jgi:hypothetical protein
MIAAKDAFVKQQEAKAEATDRQAHHGGPRLVMMV